MSYRKLLSFFLALAASMMHPACTKDSKPQESHQASQQAGSQNATADTRSGVPVTQDRSLARILPETPNAASELSAVHSIDGAVSYRWHRNDQVIVGEQSARLPKGIIRKGDTVTLVISTGSMESRDSVIIGNSPPQVTSVVMTPQDIFRGIDITAQVQSSDIDGDTVRLAYLWRINGSDILNNSPVCKGDQFKRGDRISIQVTPSDNEGNGASYQSVDYIVPNAQPVFVSIPPAEFNSDVYQYIAVARDPDDDSIVYSLGAAPQGMSIDSASGKVAWKIDRQHIGTHTIEIIARDGFGGTASQKYPLMINLSEK